MRLPYTGSPCAACCGSACRIVHTLLSRLIKSVDNLYPKLSIEIEVDSSRNLRNRLLAQEIDLTLLLGPLAEPDIENLILCDCPNGFLASPALKLGKAPFSLHDLARHPIITFGPNNLLESEVAELKRPWRLSEKQTSRHIARVLFQWKLAC